MWRVQLCRVNCIFIDALAAKLITNMVIYFPFPPKYAFKLFLLLCCCLFAFWQTSLVKAETQFESRIIKVFQTFSFQFAYKVTALVKFRILQILYYAIGKDQLHVCLFICLSCLASVCSPLLSNIIIVIIIITTIIVFTIIIIIIIRLQLMPESITPEKLSTTFKFSGAYKPGVSNSHT